MDSSKYQLEAAFAEGGTENSTERTSRKGTSSPSANHTFCPEGYCLPASSAAQSVTRPSQTDSFECFQENGYKAGMSTSPSSVPLKEGAARTMAGLHKVSRSLRGGSISMEARCSNAIQR